MLEDLFEVILERKRSPTSASYTARLLAQGGVTIAKKVGEEAVEVLLAAQVESDRRLAEEVADLFYHLLVLLAWRDIDLRDVEAELLRRRVPGDDAPESVDGA